MLVQRLRRRTSIETTWVKYLVITGYILCSEDSETLQTWKTKRPCHSLNAREMSTYFIVY